MFQKAYTMLTSEFSSLSCRAISLMNDEAHFKAALKFYVSMHSFYSVDKIIIFKNGRQSYQQLYIINFV